MTKPQESVDNAPYVVMGERLQGALAERAEADRAAQQERGELRYQEAAILANDHFDLLGRAYFVSAEDDRNVADQKAIDALRQEHGSDVTSLAANLVHTIQEVPDYVSGPRADLSELTKRLERSSLLGSDDTVALEAQKASLAETLTQAEERAESERREALDALKTTFIHTHTSSVDTPDLETVAFWSKDGTDDSLPTPKHEHERTVTVTESMLKRLVADAVAAELATYGVTPNIDVGTSADPVSGEAGDHGESAAATDQTEPLEPTAPFEPQEAEDPVPAEPQTRAWDDAAKAQEAEPVDPIADFTKRLNARMRDIKRDIVLLGVDQVEDDIRLTNQSWDNQLTDMFALIEGASPERRDELLDVGNEYSRLVNLVNTIAELSHDQKLSFIDKASMRGVEEHADTVAEMLSVLFASRPADLFTKLDEALQGRDLVASEVFDANFDALTLLLRAMQRSSDTTMLSDYLADYGDAWRQRLDAIVQDAWGGSNYHDRRIRDLFEEFSPQSQTDAELTAADDNHTDLSDTGATATPDVDQPQGATEDPNQEQSPAESARALIVDFQSTLEHVANGGASQKDTFRLYWSEHGEAWEQHLRSAVIRLEAVDPVRARAYGAWIADLMDQHFTLLTQPDTNTTVVDTAVASDDTQTVHLAQPEPAAAAEDDSSTPAWRQDRGATAPGRRGRTRGDRQGRWGR